MAGGRSARTAVAAIAAASLLGALGGCGRDSSLDGRLDRADAAATAARSDVEELTARVQELEERLVQVKSGAEAAASLEARLDDVAARLWKAIDKGRERIAAAESTAGAAAADVESALAEAIRALRELNVLKDRYDYHLRRYHGGG